MIASITSKLPSVGRALWVYCGSFLVLALTAGFWFYFTDKKPSQKQMALVQENMQATEVYKILGSPNTTSKYIYDDPSDPKGYLVGYRSTWLSAPDSHGRIDGLTVVFSPDEVVIRVSPFLYYDQKDDSWLTMFFKWFK